ncbi:MAG: DUF4189 domain-containing protein [Gammaproteobacteria bacterium]|nr:DUF4189 domain-containing protein [Gammaproteobacteria bacterium]
MQYESDTYICTDGTTIVNSTPESLEWVVNQTLHYYTNGLTNGQTKPEQVTLKFKRSGDAPQVIYKNTTEIDDATQERRLIVGDGNLNLEFQQIPNKKDAPRLNEKTAFTRCESEKIKHSFYTALIDCGGSGDYIAGVPAVVDNPLLWAHWDVNRNGSACRVAARCWGGGWVAFAYSKDEEDANTAFGAACGGTSRQDAKQQAINTCKQSGGNNCLYQVISGYDDGAVDGIDSTNKGSKLESCYDGNCEKLRD